MENKFRGNYIADAEGNPHGFGYIIPSCTYLVCTGHKLYGLEERSRDKDGNFLGFEVKNIGEVLPNFDRQGYGNNEYEFKFCKFQVVAEKVTLFLVFSDKDGKCHCIYLNEDTYDGVYGFTAIQSLVNDGNIVDVHTVFNDMEDVETLGESTISLTDYGFWDIEPNQTNYVTYSYRGRKTHKSIDGTYCDIGKHHKLTKPTVALGAGDKVVEYDKKWTLTNTHYTCHNVDD